jgi:hypothetical protein
MISNRIYVEIHHSDGLDVWTIALASYFWNISPIDLKLSLSSLDIVLIIPFRSLEYWRIPDLAIMLRSKTIRHVPMLTEIMVIIRLRNPKVSDVLHIHQIKNSAYG